MKKRQTGISLISSILLALVLNVVITGCGESGLMDIYAVSNAVRLTTIPAGAVLEPGDTIPVSLAADAESAPPETLGVRIYDSDAFLVFSRDYGVESSVILVETADIAPGFYTLNAFSGDPGNPDTELELPFFISSGAGSIRRISAYPSTVLPGEGMVLFADLAPASDDDPYIRWKAGGRIIAAGRVDEGSRLANWQVPEIPGIYPVTAEYFPFPPADNGDFPFSGSEQRSEAFVSMEQRPSRGELGPSELYSSLFHFRGTSESSGFADVPVPRIQGYPVLALEDEIFGYRFSEEDALIFDKSLIPVRNGETESFVLEMKGIFSRNGTVFTVRGQGDVQVFSLQRIEKGFLLAGDSFQIVLSLPLGYQPAEGDMPLYLAVVAEPGVPSGKVRWYADGEYQGTAGFPAVSGLSGSGLSTVIGGGFFGLLDELGIRALEPSRDGGIFGFAMRERYGRSLVMAEGFDVPWSDEFLLEGSGGCRKDGGESVLVIEKNGSAGFALPLTAATGSIRLLLSDPSVNFGVRFKQGEAESPLSIMVPEADGRIVLRIVRRDSNIYVSRGETLLASFSAEDGSGELQLWIDAEYGSLGLDSILLTLGEEHFSSRVTEAGAPPEV